MWHKSDLRTLAMLVAGTPFLAISLMAQTPDSPSIADIARQNREQKKDAPKAAKVITNDTLSPATAQSATSTPSSPAAPVSSSPVPDSSATPSDVPSNAAAVSPEVNTADSEKLKAELVALKQQFKDKQSEVDLIQRLLKLDQDSIQSKPDSSRDTDGKTKLEAELSELQLKQGELEQIKAQLKNMAAEDPTIPEAPKP